MDFKYSKKYFTATGLIAKIGLYALIGGILLFLIISIAYGHPMAGLFTVGWIPIIGVVMLIFGKSGNMTDSEYDEQSIKATARIFDKAMNKFNIEDKHIKIIEPITISGYEFNNEPEYLFKKGTDGKYRSNYHKTAIMMFGPQQMYLYVYRLGLTNEEEFESEIMEKYRYLDLDSVNIINKNVTLKIKDKEENVDFSMFEFKKNDGEILLSIPSQNDAIIDSKINEINRYIEKVKKQAQENV